MELLSAVGLVMGHAGSPLLEVGNLKLRRGMRVAVAGPAGAGQAQLLAVLAGAAEPADGEVRRSAGTRVERAGAAQVPRGATVGRAAGLGLSHLRRLEAEMRRLEKSLTTAGALERYGVLSDEFARAGGHVADAELERTLASFGLDPARLQDRFDDLSSGEKQRVLLAGALASAADVLLLDEPDAGLDREGLDWLVRRLKRWPGAVLFTSHDRAFLSRLSTHVLRIAGGKGTLARGGWPPPKHRRGSGGRGRTARRLLSWPALDVRAGGRPLFRAHGLEVHQGERIALLGQNGAGKTSLLELLGADAYDGTGSSGIVWEERVSVATLRAQSPAHSGLALLAHLRTLISDARARQLLGLMRVPESDWWLPGEDLSRDVLARVAVITSMTSGADLLLLDEPTVGLDLPAIELLEDALLARSGATIFVTHDEALALALATRVWEIAGGELRDFRGGIEGWHGGRLRLEPGLSSGSPSRGPPSAEADPDALERTETELDRIDAELADSLGVPETRLARLRARRAHLVDVASELIDSRLPPPLPRFRVREGIVVIEADALAAGVVLTLPAGTAATLRVSGTVAHLGAAGSEGTVLLPFARAALVNALTRLAFYALGVRVVQYWDPAPPAGLLVLPAGDGWHALSLAQFERLEGWVRSTKPRPSRRRRRRR